MTSTTSTALLAPPLAPPLAERIDKTIYFGRPNASSEDIPDIKSDIMPTGAIGKVVDPYYWLRDDARKNPKVLAHLELENAYTAQQLQDTEPLQEELVKTFRSFKPSVEQTKPVQWHANSPYLYYQERRADLKYKRYMRRDSRTGKEDVLLDVNLLTDQSKPEEAKSRAKGQAKDQAEGQAEAHTEPSHCDVQSWCLSPDERAFLYAVDFTGNEKYEARIVWIGKDESTLGHPSHTTEILVSGLAFASLAWSNDGLLVYYLLADQAMRPYQLMAARLQKSFHTTTQVNATHHLIYEELDSEYWLHFALTANERFLLIGSERSDTNEWRYIPAIDWSDVAFSSSIRTSEPWPPQLFWPRCVGFQYFPESLAPENSNNPIAAYLDHLWMVRCNDEANRPEHFRLKILDTENGSPNTPKMGGSLAPILPSPDQCLTWYDPQGNAFLHDVAVFQHHVAVTLKQDTVNRVVVIQRPSHIFSRQVGPSAVARVELAYDELLYNMELAYNMIYATSKLIVRYQSRTQPLTVLEVDMDTLWTSQGDNVNANVSQASQVTQSLATPFVEQPIVGYNPDLYTSELMWIPSFYGERVPVTLLYRKDLYDWGKRRSRLPSPPIYLYAYGSYGLSLDHEVSELVIPLLDRYWICAQAHVRGGADMGYDWYLQGKMHTKMNTFLDVVACAEHLSRQSLHFPLGDHFHDTVSLAQSRIALHGRSAGGLMALSSMVMRPDLFQAVIADVPFCDVLVTQQDDSIPLVTGEWSIVGNPNLKEDFVYLKQYDPMQNLRPHVEYPHLLCTAGLHDPRVAYWEPAKFMARLRYLNHERHMAESLAKQVQEQRRHMTNSIAMDNTMHLLHVDLHGHFSSNDREKKYREMARALAFLIKAVES